jgi:hypothetical protein
MESINMNFKKRKNYHISEIPELGEVSRDYYIGIVDADGLESIFGVGNMTLKELSENIFFLNLRAKANGHRNAVFYIIKLNSDIYSEVMDYIKNKDYISAGTIITAILDIRDDTSLTQINEKLQEIRKLRG